MKGKKQFTQKEEDQIILLIREKLCSSTTEQKRIRHKIRKLGFYFSDFSDKKGYNVDDFRDLVASGMISVTGNQAENQSDKPDIVPTFKKLPRKFTNNPTGLKQIENELILNNSFIRAGDIDNKVPNSTGFYCIRLVSDSKLPKEYHSILNQREHRIIYIGKAEGQSLSKRFLNQELRSIGHGTFFRSIGAVLGYRPPKGSLRLNQKNYRFAKDDITEIIDWINENLEVNWIEYSGSFGIEEQVIQKYKPLLNIKHNPSKLSILSRDRGRCLSTARTPLP